MVVEAVRRVAPVVAESRLWAETHGRMAPGVVDALAAAGLFRLVAPKEVGGWEASLPDQLMTQEILGRADPTVAWCVSNAAVAGRVAAYLEPDALARVFAAGSRYFGFSNVPGGVARSVEGGFVVDGRWPVVSGAHHADWSVLVAKTDAGESRWMLIPRSDIEVLDTWADANAMRGSDSSAVAVADAFVPEALAHSWSRRRLIDRTLYRVSTTSITATTTAACVLGTMEGALGALTALLADARSTLDGTSPRDWANIAESVAVLTAEHRSARAGLFETAAEVWRELDEHGEVEPKHRAELFAVADHAVQTAVKGVSRAYVAGTAAALRRGHVLDLALRDVHGMAINWERLRRLVFDAGRVLLGEEPAYRAM